MKTEHTPGPWEVAGAVGLADGGSSKMWPSLRGKIRSRVSGQDIVSAHCTLGVMGATVEETAANARLIAAAPNMLDALKMALKEAEADDWICAPHIRAAIELATLNGGK